MPKVYVIEDSAPNAFATGRDPKHASVTATRGLLDKLDKAELEGVIAHEMSHIGNYDIRVMTITVVLVGLVALLADFFMRWTWFGSGSRAAATDDRGGNAAAHPLRRRDPVRHPRADRRAAHPARHLAPARVPGRRLGRAALPQSGRAGPRAREDHRRPGAAGGGEQGDRAPLLRQPAARAQVLPEQPLQHAPARRGAHPAPAGDVARRWPARRPDADWVLMPKCA